MASLRRVFRKLRRRKAQRDRQIRKYQRTGRRGHARAAKKHARAVRYLRRLARRLIRENRPSPNFAYSEFDTHDGTKVPRGAYTALDHLCNTYLEPLRRKFGPVHITSGFRHTSYNASIGGASASLHIYDYPGRGENAVAADITCQRGGPHDWYSFLSSLSPGGLGRYSSFVHHDNRQRVGMPAARWSG